MTPVFRVLADDEDVTKAIADRLESLTVQDHAGTESDTATIVLDDSPPHIARPRRGVRLSIALGYDGDDQSGPVTLGQYVVDEVGLSGPANRLTIKARAADLRAGLKQGKTRVFDDVTLGDLVQTIAAEHGYTPAVGEFLADIYFPHVHQVDESDLHLLTRLARQYGAVVKPAGGKLILAEQGATKSVSGQALPEVTLTPKDMGQWTVDEADRAAYAAVEAHYHDVDAAERKTVTIGGGEPVYTIRGTKADQATATQAARAKFDALERGAATISLSDCPGNPGLLAEAPLITTGARDGVNGRWVITSATHTYNKRSGYRCLVEAETSPEAV
ncbi:MAG: late control protein [Gammaproteobacteria bacterium]|nr:late control protein [Gammaproteobacteria bacterium]